jgi:hypothetical protein
MIRRWPSENRTMRVFLWIVVAGLVCSVLGAGFGFLVGLASPEFVQLLFQPQPVKEPGRLGLAPAW